ncbi:MAG: cytochrome ubiquinol oxidase subunit I [Chloroflexota bacterium]
MPPIEVPILGRSGLVAIIALLHIPFFVNFVMGAPLLAVISEYIGLKRGDPKYDRFARHLSYLALVTVAIGALGGVGLVATNLGLFPRFFALGANIYFWPLVLELPAFLIEAIFIAAYRYTWESLREHRGWHMALGLLGAMGAWGSGFIINGLASFMLTPGHWVQTKALLDAWFNPSMFPSFLHRALAAFSITGFYAMIYALFMGAQAKTAPERDYAAWGLRYSGLWAVISTALQFVPGVWYLIALQQATVPSVVPKFLGGELAFPWFGGIILAAVAILLAFFLAVQSPQVGLKGWGRGFLVLSVLLIMITTAFMGFSRERARKPYLVYGVMYANEMLVAAPSPTPTPTAVTLLPEGKAVFAKSGCTACHSLGGQGAAVGPALDGVGKKMDAGQLAASLKVPPKGMPAFSGTPEELKALAEFLSGQ